MKMIIDTDPGVDDAMAILFAALHPGIELLGLTTVFGNVTIEQATRNALRLVERAGLDIPVAEGAGKPLELPPFEPAHIVHGPEGFGHLPAETPARAALSETAPEFLVRMARAHKGELVLCPIGPITNVAEAIRLDPEFATNVDRIVVMGGTLDAPGNVSAVAEANTWHDPHALDVVLASGAKVVMVGLDVTMQVLLKAPDFDRLAAAHPEHGSFLKAMSHFYLEFYHSKGEVGCGLHDPMAVIACLEPELFTLEETPLACVLEGPEIGRMVRAPDSGRTPALVCMDCDPTVMAERFFAPFEAAGAPA
ncbi:nucleoside hydrolase [Pseudooceanicola sp. CBS1P-1]|uniref:Nucleoside hydrolase n=1 Tax=Pseudooceanicola albus TaxID=2692189 RepID=A0A6L7G1V9_9RHOB|nr:MULTISPECIES: nucleoside hydrolase [Pseudooceanicola]MBT9385005.1 nucleoside hydrolase [Pseudooceanicola endophyticus]MXN18001.1 nucleoside hydrolase [Pseudooceanicola albus]